MGPEVRLPYDLGFSQGQKLVEFRCIYLCIGSDGHMFYRIHSLWSGLTFYMDYTL